MEKRFFKNFLDAEGSRILKALELLPDSLCRNVYKEFNESNDKDLSSRVSFDGICEVVKILVCNRLDYTSSTGKSVLDLWPKTLLVKNNSKSQKYREDGNSFLEKNELTLAIESYNKAVLSADTSSTDFAFALANRSMAWIRLQQYDYSIYDLKAVLESGLYPRQNTFKLLQRLSKAYETIGKFDDALSTYKNLLESLQFSNLTTLQVQKLKTEVQNSLSVCKKKLIVGEFVVTNPDLDDQKCTWTIKNPHKTIKVASDCLDVCFTDTMGRHAVAARDIEAGETVIVEPAAVQMIDLKKSLTHCYQCMKNTFSPWPCDWCLGVVFCSKDCKDDAIARHRFDCKLSLTDLFLQNGIQGSGFTILVFLAFQLVTQKPANFFLKNFPKLSNPESTALPIGAEGLEPYDIILNLAIHFKDKSNLINKIAVALFLNNALEQTGYFQHLEEFKKSPTEIRTYFATLLFRLSVAVDCNNHAINEVVGVPMGVERERVALGLFPTVASVINHSCDPNTSTVMIGTSQVTVATRKIFKGEQICHIYQCHFGDTPREQRQSSLKRFYNFDCCCEGCEKDFPMAKFLPKLYEESFSKLDLEKSRQLDAKHSKIGDLILDSIDSHDLKKVQQLYTDRLNMAAEFSLPRPHLIYLSNRTGLIDSMWLRFGNRSFDSRHETLKGAYV